MTKELAVAIRIARLAGRLALAGLDGKVLVKTKSDGSDIVTSCDIKVERFIVSELRRIFPKHDIMREEEDDIFSNADWVWVIDPIDGTKYFTHGVKMFTTALALWYKGEPRLGVVYNPATDDCYYAESGSGAFLNKKRIYVSRTKNIKAATVALVNAELQRLSSGAKKLTQRRLDLLYNNCFRFRALGSGTLSLCYLAQGYFDAYFDLTGREKLVDIAAGINIVKEAGGVFSGLDGQWHGYDIRHLVVTNGLIHKDFLRLLNK